MSNCESCESKKAVLQESVPYVAYESSMARMERQIRRMWIALLLSIAMIFASNGIWCWYLSLYDFSGTYEEVVVDGGDGGDANYIGQDGNIYNGEGYGQESY